MALLSAWGEMHFLPSLDTVLGVLASEVGWDVHLGSPGPRPLGLDRNRHHQLPWASTLETEDFSLRIDGQLLLSGALTDTGFRPLAQRWRTPLTARLPCARKTRWHWMGGRSSQADAC